MVVRKRKKPERAGGQPDERSLLEYRNIQMLRINILLRAFFMQIPKDFTTM